MATDKIENDSKLKVKHKQRQSSGSPGLRWCGKITLGTNKKNLVGKEGGKTNERPIRQKLGISYCTAMDS